MKINHVESPVKRKMFSYFRGGHRKSLMTGTEKTLRGLLIFKRIMCKMRHLQTGGEV